MKSENKKLLIVTGGSSGIGKSIVEVFNENFDIISISRSIHNSLNESVNQIQIDFSKEECFDEMENLFNSIKFEQFDEIFLINNAGTLGQIDRLENIEMNHIQSTIQINLTVSSFLISSLNKKVRLLKSKIRIINISSGAATKPYYGWSIYCSTKAAIDMLTKVVAEENRMNFNYKILSIYPGVVDTSMQSTIRNSSEEQFEQINRFIALKEENELKSPFDVASKLHDTLMKDEFQSGDVIRLF